MFYDEYKYPIIQKKQKLDRILAEKEFKVQESLRRRKDLIRKAKAYSEIPTVSMCTRQLKEKRLPETASNQRAFISSRASISIGSSTAITRNSAHNRFELDYASSQLIKNKVKSFKESVKTHRVNSYSEKKIKTMQPVSYRYQQVPFFQELMGRYRYPNTKFYETLTQLAYLAKISSLFKDTSQVKDVPATLMKDYQTITRLFELTKHDPIDISNVIDYCNYDNPLVSLKVMRVYYKRLTKVCWGGFTRMVIALEIPISEDLKVTIDGFFRIKCYLVDNWANEREYIDFGKRFIDPFGTNKVRGEDIMTVLKSILIREDEDNTNRELLLKALLSNFVLCGIIDIKGNFQPGTFVEVYSTGKMNIMSFIKILFS